MSWMLIYASYFLPLVLLLAFALWDRARPVEVKMVQVKHHR